MTTTPTIPTDYEASQLRWAPGVWPLWLVVESGSYRRAAAIMQDGGLAAVRYTSPLYGTSVIVWND